MGILNLSLNSSNETKSLNPKYRVRVMEIYVQIETPLNNKHMHVKITEPIEVRRIYK